MPTTRFLGHACITITNGKHNFIIDPFLSGNPLAVAKAVEFLKPKKVVPVHYNTFPVISQDPQEFAKRVKTAQVVILKPGESIDY